MKFKLALLLDSVLSSATNFLITFLLLKYVGNEAVVAFGVSMTLALIFLSFQRAVILVPFNLLLEKNQKETVKELYSGALVVLTISLIVVSVSSYFITKDIFSVILAVTMFCFLSSHELLRYVVMTTRAYFFPFIFSFSFFSIVATAVYFDKLTLGTLAKSYCLIFFLELFLLAMFSRSVKSVGRKLDMLHWFRDSNVLFKRNLQSVSQLFLVHAPFLIVSTIYPAVVASVLFVARSVFQPVQIVIKSIESVDQRRISSNELTYKTAIFLFKKYGFISFLSSLICLIASHIFFKYGFEVAEKPDLYVLTFWMLTSVLLSLSRSNELFMLKLGLLGSMNFNYFIAGFFVCFFCSFGVFTADDILISFYIVAGWFMLLIFHIFSLRKSFIKS